MVKSYTESRSLLVGWLVPLHRILKFPCSNTGYADGLNGYDRPDMLTRYARTGYTDMPDMLTCRLCW